VHDKPPAVEHVFDPGDDVTAYPVTGEPPSSAGATHDTVACPFPGNAVTAVGAPGTGGQGRVSVSPFENADAAGPLSAWTRIMSRMPQGTPPRSPLVLSESTVANACGATVPGSWPGRCATRRKPVRGSGTLPQVSPNPEPAGVTSPRCGVPGMPPVGLIGLEEADAGPVPIALVAVTVKV
jgi:hypothetical protein